MYPIALNGHTLEYVRCDEYKKGVFKHKLCFSAEFMTLGMLLRGTTTTVVHHVRKRLSDERQSTFSWHLLKPLHWEISTALSLSFRQVHVIGFF